MLGVAGLRWAGGSNDGQEVASNEQFVDGTGRRIGHPDANNAGEIIPIRGNK